MFLFPCRTWALITFALNAIHQILFINFRTCPPDSLICFLAELVRHFSPFYFYISRLIGQIIEPLNYGFMCHLFL